MGGATLIFPSDTTLLQDGVEWTATSTTVSYDAWVEYVPGPDKPQFTVGETNEILAEAWACDSNGNLNYSGGYGCFFIEDTTTGTSVTCNKPTAKPCPSIQAPSTFKGYTAEFILEKKTQFMPDHFGAPISSAESLDTNGTWETFGADAYTLATITGVHGGLIDYVGVGSSSVSFSFNEKEGGD
jgi:hypothetical protein